VTAKFRQNAALPIAALVAFLGASALATQRWWLLPVLLIPLTAMWWGIRTGIDVDARALRVRGMLGSRMVLWSEVAGFRVEGSRVFVRLVGGGELVLPAVRPVDLPKVIAAAGSGMAGRPPEPAPKPEADSQ
jgi:hypothetical protein